MIAIYARQSIDKKDSISIEGQIELCKKECDGETIEYIDKGYSGKNIDRPAFTELFKAVERGDINKVVVYRLDRISRSITDFGRIWDIFKEHNVEFVSVNEKFDTTSPVGRAMIYIIMVFAQLERETIAQRIKDNYHQRAKTGAYLGGPAPYGFNIKRTEINGKKASMLIPNDNIEIVKQLFEKYAYSNMSLGKLSEWLVNQNIRGINRETWDNVSISRILHNPVYVKADADIYYYYQQKKIIIYNEIEEYTGEKALCLFGKRDRGQNKYNNLDEHLLAIAHHDGVVPPKTFLLCQYKLDSNKQLKNSGSGSYSWLTGLVKCGYCGYSMRVISSNGGRYVYFNCTGRSNYKICKVKHENAHINDVEPFVLNEIQIKINEIKNMNVYNDAESSDNNILKIELVQINNQISNLIDNLANSNGATVNYINERISKLDGRKSEIAEELKKSVIKNEPLIIPDEDFIDIDFNGKKNIARRFIKCIRLFNDKISIEWLA